VEEYNLPAFPTPLGSGNTGVMVTFTLSYGQHDLVIQLIQAHANKTPADIVRTFWGSHMCVWFSLIDNSLVCFTGPEAEASKVSKEVVIPPAALLNHVAEILSKDRERTKEDKKGSTALLNLDHVHVAHMLIAAVKLFAGSVDPTRMAIEEKIPLDYISSLSQKLAPASDPQGRERQRKRAQYILSKLLWGKLKGAGKPFSDPAYNVFVNSVRRQSSRYMRDSVEGRLSFDWRLSLMNLVDFLRLQTPHLLSPKINSLTLANVLSDIIVARVVPDDVNDEADEEADEEDDEEMDEEEEEEDADDNDDDNDEGEMEVDGENAAPAPAPSSSQLPSSIPRFGNKKKTVKPPPANSKAVKETSSVFSRFFRLSGNILGDEAVRTAVREALKEHVDAISREMVVAGQIVTHTLLQWWKNKGTERAPVITKRHDNASEEFFRHSLTEGRNFSRGQHRNAAPAPTLFVGGQRISRSDRVPGDNRVVGEQSERMREMSALRLGMDKIHGIVPKMFAYLNCAVDRVISDALSQLSRNDSTRATLVDLQKQGSQGDPRKKLVNLVIDCILRLQRKKIVKRGADFDTLGNNDIKDVDYSPFNDLATAMNVDFIPEVLLDLIDKVSGWLWEGRDANDSHLGPSESDLKRKERKDKKAIKGKARAPKKASKSVRSHGGFKAPRALRKENDVLDGPLDLAGFKAILDRNNNRVRMGANVLLHMLEEMEEWIKELSPEAQREYLGMNFKKTCESLQADARGDPGAVVEEDNAGEGGGKKNKAAKDALNIDDVVDDFDGDLDYEDDYGKVDRSDDDEYIDVNAPGVPIISPPPGKVTFRGRRFYAKLFTILPSYKLRRRHIRLDGLAVLQVIRAAYLTKEAKYRCLGPLVGRINVKGLPVADVIAQVFNIPPDANGTFAASIVTDGYSLILPHNRDINTMVRKDRPVGPRSSYSSVPGKGYAPNGKVRIAIAKREAPPRPPPPTSLPQSTPTQSFSKIASSFAKYLRVVAVDPGISNLVTCFEWLKDGTYRIWQLSRERWRDETCAEKRLRDTQKWCKPLKAAFAVMNDPSVSPKTSSSLKFALHIAATESVKNIIFAETLRSRWADAVFHYRQLKTQSLDLFWSEVIAGSVKDGTAGIQPMFAYGDAGFRGRSTPTTGMVKAVQRIAGLVNFVFIDEFRTTMCCTACGWILLDVRTYNSSSKHDAFLKRRAANLAARGEKEDPDHVFPDNWVVRGQKICRNSNCPDSHSSIVARDVNPCKTMITIFNCEDAGLPKPAHLYRSFKFTQKQRAYAKRNPYYHPEDLDDSSFKVPHGFGDPTLAGQRSTFHKNNSISTGWTAPVAGPLNNTRLLLPTSPLDRGLSSGSRWQTPVWPLNNQMEQTRKSVEKTKSVPRVVGERMGESLTAAPSSPFTGRTNST